MWTSAWQSYRYGDGCGVSVCWDSAGLFSPCLNTRLASGREWSRQRRREEKAQMSTKAKVMAAGEHILKPRPGRHVKRRLSALRNQPAARSFTHRNFRHDPAVHALNIRRANTSLRQIFNSVAFPVPRVTFVSSLHTKVVLPCPAVFIVPSPPPPLGEKWSPPNAAHLPSMGKCFHDVLTSWTVCAYTSRSVGIYVFSSEQP